jgi:protein O-mannosyl-transferase
MKQFNFHIKNEHIFLLFIGLGFVLYGNTIGHDYALDDAIVISENQFTKEGISGIKDLLWYDTFTGFFGKEKQLVAGGRYRPFSLITFAIEYEFFGLNPYISHFINISLYILTVIFLFLVLQKSISAKNKNTLTSISFISSILYLFHPIHTEVVANIKGRDEILAFLFSLISLYYTIKFLEINKYKYLIYSGISFFFGLLSKENTITFLAIIPLTIYFFRNERFKLYVKSTIPLLISTIIFLTIRRMVLGEQPSELPGELMNNPFIVNGEILPFFERIPTILLTFGMYLKLLIFPHPLTYDYYPKQIPIISWLEWRAILPFLIYSSLLVFAIIKLRKKHIISFAVLFYLATFSIVSNIVFPIGTFMNERFMYISSFGFCLAIGYLLSILMQKSGVTRIVGLFVLLFILSGYTYKTIDRNKAWKNDFTLFVTDVETSSNSAKSNCSAGGKLIEHAMPLKDTLERKKYFEDAIKYLEKAISIHPTYADALLLLGNAHYEYNRNYEKTLDYYMQILKRNPYNEHVFKNIFVILNTYSDIDKKVEVLSYLIKYYPNNFDLNYQLGLLHGRYKGELDDAIPYLEKAIQLKPKSKDALKDLGVAYGMKNEIQKSLDVFLKTVEYFPNDDQIYYNIGISYSRLGQEQKAQEYFTKAKQLNPNLK